jgi:glycerol-1-phosphate dehydrogenase [NAD(P)+]
MMNTSADPIVQLLAGDYVDPDGQGRVGVTTKSLNIARSLAGMERELVQALGFGRRLAMVSDPRTHEVLGSRLERALAGSFAINSIVFPDAPHPDDVTAANLRSATAHDDALIAIGSGSINDLCKYASAQDGKPYAVFATAPSMNGYTSVNAAITVHGHKMSLAAHAPVGAFFDLSILAAAPARLIRAGLGDSLCRATSQADWLLAHLLLGKPYRQLPYALLADDEPPLFDNASALVSGDIEIMERLVRTLILSGFGTAIVGNSQPASQGEHLISHFIDMFEPDNRPLIYHGEQIGVTTLSMARLQNELLAHLPHVAPDTGTREDFVARYGEDIGDSCWQEFSQKRIDREEADRLNDLISKRRDEIQTRIRAISLSPQSLASVLLAAGAPITPDQIFLKRDFYDTALLQCRTIRNRFTFLDLAAASGQLNTLVHKI